MATHTPGASFGYQDFILIRAAYDDVVWAMGRTLAETDASIQPTCHADEQPPALMRVLRGALSLGRMVDGTNEARGYAGAVAVPEPLRPYRLFRGGEAAGPPLTRDAPPAFGTADPTDMFADGWDDVRVSAVSGEEDLIVTEMREFTSGFSSHAFGLSMHLPETDILYFRRSGDAATESHHDFHLYRSGETLRRVLCHANWPQGDPDRAWWEGIADGEATRYEPPGLYYGATEADLLSGAALDVILGSFGLTTTALFRAGATRAPTLYSRRAGGEFLPA